ncbi:MAG: hypothetical protein SW833_27360 [Cyanobacteriota bacterium]|nr:hypothetical protein [Cyanobacteriota bacterium]
MDIEWEAIARWIRFRPRSQIFFLHSFNSISYFKTQLFYGFGY